MTDRNEILSLFWKWELSYINIKEKLLNLLYNIIFLFFVNKVPQKKSI